MEYKKLMRNTRQYINKQVWKRLKARAKERKIIRTAADGKECRFWVNDDVADYLDMTHENFSRIVNHRCSIKKEYVDVLCDIFGCSPYYLYGWTENYSEDDAKQEAADKYCDFIEATIKYLETCIHVDVERYDDWKKSYNGRYIDIGTGNSMTFEQTAVFAYNLMTVVSNYLDTMRTQDEFFYSAALSKLDEYI